MSATRYGHTRPLIRHRAMGYNYFFGQLINDDPMSMDRAVRGRALVSTVLDLIKWHQALEEGELVVDRRRTKQMYRPDSSWPTAVTRPYGYGWGLGEMAGHRTSRPRRRDQRFLDDDRPLSRTTGWP